MKKIHQVSSTTEYDSETGEVTKDTRRTVIRIPQEPSYIKLYVEDIHNLFRLPANSDTLLLALLENMTYKGEVIINKRLKLDIANKIGLTSKTPDKQVAHKITHLVEKGILIKVDRATYSFNPYLFAKGAWSEVAQKRDTVAVSGRLIIDYTENGKRIFSSSTKLCTSNQNVSK